MRDDTTVDERLFAHIPSGEETARLMFEYQIYTLASWGLQVVHAQKLS